MGDPVALTATQGKFLGYTGVLAYTQGPWRAFCCNLLWYNLCTINLLNDCMVVMVHACNPRGGLQVQAQATDLERPCLKKK